MDKYMIQTWYAQDLEEFYRHIMTIGRIIEKKDEKQSEPILWFRGHSYDYYNLNPNIFRNAKADFNRNNTYSSNHLREDYRFQNFMARNYDKLDKAPNSVIEWQQIMQHYFTKTRLMDWSESARTALLFALEPYINPLVNKELEQKRMDVSPVVWLLNPGGLNQTVYDCLLKQDKVNGGYPMIERALRGLADPAEITGIACRIGDELREHPGIYFSTNAMGEHNMNGMISLSALELLKKSYSGTDLLYALESMELNPFFYLLLRYYSDGLGVCVDCLPPLATVHPYYSQRIRVQKGEFTIFPHYLPDEKIQYIRGNAHASFDPVSMEYMKLCKPFLYRIVITNPVEIASELLLTGERRGDLYPEMETVSIDMENGEHQI